MHSKHTSENSMENLDSFYFLTSLCLLTGSLKNDVNVPSKSIKKKKLKKKKISFNCHQGR